MVLYNLQTLTPKAVGGAREETHTFCKGTFLVRHLAICEPIISKNCYQTLSVECLKV